MIVVFTTRTAVTGESKATVAEWRSCRSRRVVRSTIAGEASAADEGVDHDWFAAVTLTEILGERSALEGEPALEHRHATDCRSLYDAVMKENPNTEEKRVVVNIRSIQQSIPSPFFHWVPTDKMFADGLTKDDPALRANFTDWLRCPTVRLHA